MPNRPPLHRQYRARERKDWDRGFVKQKRLTGRALQQRNNRIKMRDQFTCQNIQCSLVTTELRLTIECLLLLAVVIRTTTAAAYA